VLEPAIALVARTLRARLAADGKPAPADDADVLEVWRALVKGDPTWNAIRDNCRSSSSTGTVLRSVAPTRCRQRRTGWQCARCGTSSLRAVTGAARRGAPR
jgi:hypothetical protein